MNQSKMLHSLDLDNISLVSTTELADFLKRKPQTIRMWLHEDRLPFGLVRPIKINNRNYWFEDDVKNYLKTLKTANVKCL
ncbi:MULTISPECIES: helix-turn-helix transcriptional regulator [Enterobacteriaceae]|uniref:helix-turn-helix transcriptional regulator n=1 Tax=Enterobacteriaceae TaxID=543 RepID=UPI0007E8F170|nr:MULTISPECIES: helix-turn-helix domain-containing protein [Enterobacteriaceae]MCM7094473.1 helix-turn-helix domain-containing protein [Enterobacter kobei]MDM2729951.1 helix-turn-helix domain-containing protein [Citrobacter sp. Cy070]MDW2642628.1 helix-turn-helix domain-containing protein [Citrobacter sp. HN-141]MDW2652119.1 helix-turn-helix domain-containing protein [Citrobacter sp. HN-120]MDW2695144.1 helix-turn-helix domain-containing protein [Citrobacter sp. HN-144]